MQRERRRDPYPWTWEIPVAVALATLFVIVIGIQLGRPVANLLAGAGAGWTWPDSNAGAIPSPIGTAFWTSLPGVLGGHADAGLPTPTPDGLAGRGLVWVSLALTEAALLTATICAPSGGTTHPSTTRQDTPNGVVVKALRPQRGRAPRAQTTSPKSTRQLGCRRLTRRAGPHS